MGHSVKKSISYKIHDSDNSCIEIVSATGKEGSFDIIQKHYTGNEHIDAIMQIDKEQIMLMIDIFAEILERKYYWQDA